MSENNDNSAWVGEFIRAVFRWFFLILAGAWIVCQWLTRLLFEFVINPLLDRALERHDGLVVLLSAGLWAAVALLLSPLLIVPALQNTSPEEVWQALLIMLGLGLAWGTSIGFWILLTWWMAVERSEPAYEPLHMLGEPIAVLPPSPDNVQPSLPTDEELEANLAEIFGQEEVLQGESLG
jgi:hypothetical protein